MKNQLEERPVLLAFYTFPRKCLSHVIAVVSDIVEGDPLAQVQAGTSKCWDAHRPAESATQTLRLGRKRHIYA